ncbi:hypothetical protein [Ornithinibacillus caprae]|nr:hypothetical protein [Ornithinibacillus caprae]
MKFFIGLITGFIGGCFYALYQTVEAPEGKIVGLMESIKAVLGVF